MLEFSDYYSDKELKFIRLQTKESKIRFSKGLLQLIHKKQWLRIAIPHYRNGNPMSALEIALLFEALAYADGSLGWAINLGAGANMFLGYLNQDTSKRLANIPNLWLAGSGAPTGTAIETENGYIVSGYWKYASGSLYATHFTANAYLYNKNKQPILNCEKNPIYRSFLFPAKEVEILNTWNTLGLRASCSNDYKLQAVFVPSEYGFDLTKNSFYNELSLYRYPFDAFAVSNIAVMCTGITQHFIELFEQDILTKKSLYDTQQLKENSKVKNLFNTLSYDFYKSRSLFLADLKKLEYAVEHDKANIKEKEARLQLSAKCSVDAAYRLVMELYRFCGMNTVFVQNELNKVVQDFLVATQHYSIRPYTL